MTENRRRIHPDAGNVQPFLPFFAQFVPTQEPQPKKKPSMSPAKKRRSVGDSERLPKDEPNPADLIRLDNFRLRPEHAARLEEVRTRRRRARLEEYLLETGEVFETADREIGN